jgi:DNA-binding response OmpR family regulator
MNELSSSLQDLSVLVLEDDFYLADDARYALEAAGARVVGPYGDAGDAIAEVDQRKPNCAVIDINLGRGPNFAPARALLARGVPIIFITGYDCEVIPEDLSGAVCMQKPVDGRRVVGAVEAICGRRT